MRKQFSEAASKATTYILDHSTNGLQPKKLMSTLTGVEDKIDDLIFEYRRLLMRNSIAADRTPEAINSTQSKNHAKLLKITSAQQQQLSFSAKITFRKIANNQNLPNNHTHHAIIFPQPSSSEA